MTSEPPNASYQHHRELEFEVAAALTTLQHTAAEHTLDASARSAKALGERIAQRRFTIAVIGEFKRGKSTLLNALLGGEVLPADVLPTTATVNRVTYGVVPRAWLHFNDARAPEQVPVAALSDHVTKLTPESGAVAQTVREAVVEWPIRLCQNNVDLIDTPGMNDEAAMDALTLDFLPNVDAALFTVMADAPFSESEARLLEALLRHNPSCVVYAITAIDRLRVSERQRCIDAICRRIEACIDAYADAHLGDEGDARAAFLARHRCVRAFAVSGVQALDARLDRDDAALEASGLLALERFLERFLVSRDALGFRRRVRSALRLCQTIQADLADVPEPAADALNPHPRLAALTVAVQRATHHTMRAWELGLRRFPMQAALETLTARCATRLHGHIDLARADIPELIAAIAQAPTAEQPHPAYRAFAVQQAETICADLHAVAHDIIAQRVCWAFRGDSPPPIPLSACVTFGAAEDNDIVLKGAGVAPYHAAVRFVQRDLILQAQPGVDLSVNGETVQRAVVRLGDRCTFGEHTMRLKAKHVRNLEPLRDHLLQHDFDHEPVWSRCLSASRYVARYIAETLGELGASDLFAPPAAEPPLGDGGESALLPPQLDLRALVMGLLPSPEDVLGALMSEEVVSALPLVQTTSSKTVLSSVSRLSKLFNVSTKAWGHAAHGHIHARVTQHAARAALRHWDAWRHQSSTPIEAAVRRHLNQADHTLAALHAHQERLRAQALYTSEQRGRSLAELDAVSEQLNAVLERLPDPDVPTTAPHDADVQSAGC